MYNRILIQGYYGFGNLGDDILLKVSYAWLKNLFPEAELVIYNNNRKARKDYIAQWLEAPVQTIDYSANQKFDLIVHGGGGVHYDFDNGGLFFGVLNVAIRFIGADTFLKIFRYYKGFKNKKQISTKYRIGVGVGVGTFTPTSRKLYSNLSILGDYDIVMIRDKGSESALLKYNRKAKIIKSTDLAFFAEAWQPKNLINTQIQPAKVGFVLRYWRYDSTHVEEVITIAKSLKQKEIDCQFFSFEEEYDEPTNARIRNESLPLTVWRPEDKSTFFFDLMSQCQLIVTTRFHGALIGNVLGLPSICIQIEPKLNTVLEMLPESSQLLLLTDIGEVLETRIVSTIENISHWNRKVKQDFNVNNLKIKSDLEELGDLLTARI